MKRFMQGKNHMNKIYGSKRTWETEMAPVLYEQKKNGNHQYTVEK